MSYEPDNIYTLTFNLPTLTVLTSNVPRLMNLRSAKILAIDGSLGSLTVGNLVVTIKNDAGTTLATLTWNLTGFNGLPTVNIVNNSIAAGDHFNVSVTTAASVAANCFVIIYLRIAALA